MIADWVTSARKVEYGFLSCFSYYNAIKSLSPNRSIVIWKVYKLCASVPNSSFTFKLEPLCQAPKSCFERRIPPCNIPFHSVR